MTPLHSNGCTMEYVRAPSAGQPTVHTFQNGVPPSMEQHGLCQIPDTITHKTMACSFTEISPIMNSYWAEIGLYSIHIFIKALYEHFSLDSRSVEICCNNEMMLTEAVGHPKQVSTGTASVNVFRGIRAITRTNTKIQWKYTWVKAHMDEVLPWTDSSDEAAATECNVHGTCKTSC